MSHYPQDHPSLATTSLIRELAFLANSMATILLLKSCAITTLETSGIKEDPILFPAFKTVQITDSLLLPKTIVTEVPRFKPSHADHVIFLKLQSMFSKTYQQDNAEL
jgi:hypothetical protein